MDNENSDRIKTLFNTHVMPTYAPSIALVRGKGTKVWDADGKVYLDFSSGIAVVNAGHCHPRITEAIARQAATLVHVSNLYYTENQAKLAERICALAGVDAKCFFCNSGAEANEAMVKLARLWGAESCRYEIVTMHQSFHGRTLATVAATGQEKVKLGFAPLPHGFVHAQFNALDSVRACVNEKTVGILIEAVQGEGGVLPADPDFVAGVRALCDEHNLLMLCDEVQCGMGRTGQWFGFQAYDARPDAFSLAKALGNGFPIGALVATGRLKDVFSPGKHASTFGGTPLACAAALATLDVIAEEGLVEAARASGDIFEAGLRALVERYAHVVEVRGRGLMLGLALDQDAAPVAVKLRDAGLLCIPTAVNVLRFLPPLNVKAPEIEEALEILDDVLAEWHGTATDS